MAPVAHDTNAPYLVASPRSGDAVGEALRMAYEDRKLPDDMLALLAKLNRTPTDRSH